MFFLLIDFVLLVSTVLLCVSLQEYSQQRFSGLRARLDFTSSCRRQTDASRKHSGSASSCRNTTKSLMLVCKHGTTGFGRSCSSQTRNAHFICFQIHAPREHSFVVRFAATKERTTLLRFASTIGFHLWQQKQVNALVSTT